MSFLLDTNAWIDYLKNRVSPIRAKLSSLSPTDILLCSVVKAELLHGAEKYGNRERRLAVLSELFAPYRSLPFDDISAGWYARIRNELEAVGSVIGPYDLQIAAIGLAHGLTVVTSNTREYSRISKLKLENWIEH